MNTKPHREKLEELLAIIRNIDFMIAASETNSSKFNIDVAIEEYRDVRRAYNSLPTESTDQNTTIDTNLDDLENSYFKKFEAK